MKFTAAGDALCQRRLPEGYDGFDAIRAFLSRGDARFFNFESTVHYEGECYGCQHSGGTYVRCDPEVLEDMLQFNFNCTTFNNNHAMDFAHEGLVRTLEYMNATGIVHAGVGLHLDQAAAPAYLETPKGRVALIAVCTSFAPPMMAGVQSRRFRGRPGINGITVKQILHLPKADFEAACRIGDLTGINNEKKITRAEGYFPQLPAGTCEIGEQLCTESEEYGVSAVPNESDVARIRRSIREAKLQADYVMVSIHAHQILSMEKSDTPDFLQALCRDFVDSGADAVIGHGPHLLRAIEIYQRKPIFYSLGDFVLQLYQIPIAPEDFYAKYGIDSSAPVIELLEKRSAGFTRGLMEDPRMMETVIPYWETDENNDLIRLELLPVQLSKGEGKHLEGLPRPAKDTAFMERLSAISKPYGTTMEQDGDLWVCHWEKE